MLTRLILKSEPTRPATTPEPEVLDSPELADLIAAAETQQAEQDRRRRLEAERVRPLARRARYEYD